MAEGQELDNLLIKVDSELGDLKGIESAISALERLSTINKDASKMVSQLGKLGTELHKFDNLKLDGLNDSVQGVHGMVSALQKLTTVTGSATKAIGQLGKLGDTLRKSFDGIGHSLEGIDKVSIGVLNLVGALDRLTQISGSANGAIRQLGNLGDSLKSFGGVNKDDIEKLVTPIKELMQAIGTLGNNNVVSIKLDNSGVAHVNQVIKHTKKNMKDFTDFWAEIKSNREKIDLGSMFDLSQPTEDLQRNLSHAQRMLVTYENQARTTLEKLHNAQASFSMKDLMNDKSWRTQFGSHMIADKMVEQLKEGIDRVKTELEGRGTQELEDAWQHTLDTIANDIGAFDISDLIRVDLPIDQMRANLRQMENALSRAMSNMQRAQENMNRIRSRISDESARRGDSGYRESYYTYQVNAEYVRRYREEIENLQRAINQTNITAPNDTALLRELPQLQQQLTRYQEAYDRLSSQSSLSDEQLRQMGTYERGIELIRDRIQHIHDMLEQIPQSEEGVLEMMRQIADEAERADRATEEMNQNMRNSVGEGFGAFGSMLSKSGNPLLGSIGNLTSLFGKSVQNNTARLSNEALSGLQGLASTLGTVATGMSQVIAVASVFVSAFKTFIGIADKASAKIGKFVTGLLQFAKNMLTHVVGAFNAVAGAVSRVASAVRSGAEVVASALRKIADFGSKVIEVFSRLGGVISLAFKGTKAIANFITPKAVKNIVSYNGSLKSIIKNVHLLNKAIQITNKWFTMLTRMLMRKIVQAFLSQMKDAFDQLVVWEKNANDEMLKLNTNVSKMYSGLLRSVYQLVAAFEPLINAIATPVEAFLDSLSSMGENLAKFMAILTGQPYYLRVRKFYKDYGEQVEETNKKVKNLTNGLDELNILNDSKDNDDWDIGNYIEKVPVNGSIDLGFPSLKEILDQIKDWLRNIPWDKIKEKVREIIHRIMSIINEILKDLDLWGLIGDTIGELFNTFMVAWNQFITDFDPVATEKALSELIVRALNKIDWDLIHENIELTAKKFAQFWNEVFADDRLWDTITKTITNFLNEIVHYFDTWAWTFNFEGLARQLTRSLTNILEGFDYEQLRHAVEGWVTGLVDFINKVVSDKKFWKTLGESIAKIINSTIIEALKDLTGLNFEDMSDSIKLAITNAIDNIKWEDLEESIRKLAENITRGLNDFFGDEEFLTKVTTALAGIGNIILNAIKTSLETLNAEDIGNAIGTAIGKGLETVDWDTVFSLPSSAINKLSEAIKGLLDSIPDDFNLGTWLAEHLKITLDGIDWELIHQNVEDFATKVSDYINGLLADKEFWKSVGSFAGETLDVIWDLTIKPLANVNLNDLVDSIKTAIREAWEKFNFEEKMGDLGGLTQKIIDAVDHALTTTNWREIGRQIGDGISAFLDKINPESIAKTIFDAFVALSDSIGGILEKMLANEDFYKIGQIIANAFYGILGGLAYFLDTNASGFSKAIDQLAKGINDFLAKHEDEIVFFLNKIIDAIGKILSAKSSARHELVERLANILKRTNLGDLLGTIIAGAIKKWIDGTILKVAMLEGIAQSFGGLVSKIFNTLKPYIFNAILSVASAWVMSKLAGIITTAILSAFGVAGLPAIIIGAIVTAIAKAIGGITGWNIADKLKEIFAGFFNKNNDKTTDAKDYKQHWWEFWKEEAPEDVTYEPTVTIDPKIDDSNLEGINWDDYFQDRQNQVIIDDPKFGTITASKIESEEFAGKILNVDEINAQVLNLGDIFADKLKVKEIEVTNGTDEVNNELDKFYAGAPTGAEGGVLGAERGFDTITTRLLEVTEKTTTPLLEVGEKITTPLLEVTEKITSKLLEITEKIKTPLLEVEKMFVQLFEVLKVTTPLLEAEKLTTKELEIASLKVATLLADNINTTQIKTIDIIADRLKVGVIDGQLSGGTSGTTTISLGGGSSTYDWMFGNGGTVQKPTFTTEDRWSDISGLPSAEDFLSDLSDTYGSIITDADKTLADTEGTYWSKWKMPKLYADNETDATGGELTNPKNDIIHYSDEELDRALNWTDQRDGSKNTGLGKQLYSIEELPSNAEQVRDSLMELIGNENSTYALMGRLYDTNGLNFDVEQFKNQLANNPEVLETLKNASSLRDATKIDSIFSNDESDTYSRSRSWAYGAQFADALGHYEGEEEPTGEGEEEEKKDKEGIKNVDEFNVIGDETTGTSRNPLSFLENLPLMTEYIMAQVYDIIDKWLRRIYKLLKSFEVPQSFLDLFKDMNFDELDGDIEIPILEEIAKKLDILNYYLSLLLPLLKQLKDSIDKLESAVRTLSNNVLVLNSTMNNLISAIKDLINKLGDITANVKTVVDTWIHSFSDDINRLIDAINSLKDKLDDISATATATAEAWADSWADSSNGLITSVDGLKDAINNVHIDTWTDSTNDLIDSIRVLGDRIDNIKCECTCCCNCKGCDKSGGTGTGTGGYEPTREGWYDGGDTIPDNPSGYQTDTHTHDTEDYWGYPTQNESGDGGYLTNDNGGGLTVDEALEEGLERARLEIPKDVAEEMEKDKGLVANSDTKTGHGTLKDAKGNVIKEWQASGLWDNKFYDGDGNLVMDFGDTKVASAKGNIKLTTKDGKEKTFNLRDVHAIYNQVGVEGLQQVKDRLSNSGGSLSDDYFSGYTSKKTDVKTGLVTYYDGSGNVLHERHLDGTWGGITYKNGEPVNQSRISSFSDIDTKLSKIDIGDSSLEFNSTGSGYSTGMLKLSPSKPETNQAKREAYAKVIGQNGGAYVGLSDSDAVKAGFASLRDLYNALKEVGYSPMGISPIQLPLSSLPQFANKFQERMKTKGYQMGGVPNSGEIFVARENGIPEFVGSFGNRSVVANNDQIVTAVANGVSMANDSLRNAIEAQTNALEQAIDRKDLDVKIGDRQIAEANRRGEQGMGTTFVK